MQLTDTHCHIQEAGALGSNSPTQAKWQQAGITDPMVLISQAKQAGVTRLICVGNTLEDSKQAVALAQSQASCWATIGLHPHVAQAYVTNPRALHSFKVLAKQPKVVGIGECGLDYYYNHSSKSDQLAMLRFHLHVAGANNLPLVFHIRDAFADFWPVFDQFPGLRGVVHSFSATTKELDQALSRGLYIGLNGIMTFTKKTEQLEAARQVPLSKLLLETDAPYLTPTPYRGTLCQPKHVRLVAEFLSQLRGESLDQLAATTTRNAQALFKID